MCNSLQKLREAGSVSSRRREADIEIIHIMHGWELAGDLPDDAPLNPMVVAKQQEQLKQEQGGQDGGDMGSMFGANFRRNKNGDIVIGGDDPMIVDECGRQREWYNITRLSNQYKVQNSHLRTTINTTLTGESNSILPC